MVNLQREPISRALRRYQAIWINPVHFDIIDKIDDIETVAKGPGIRNLSRLQKTYGPGIWRKMKGVARIRLANGRIRWVELHWYEAHGIGKKEMKKERVSGVNYEKIKRIIAGICGLHQ